MQHYCGGLKHFFIMKVVLSKVTVGWRRKRVSYSEQSAVTWKFAAVSIWYTEFKLLVECNFCKNLSNRCSAATTTSTLSFRCILVECLALLEQMSRWKCANWMFKCCIRVHGHDGRWARVSVVMWLSSSPHTERSPVRNRAETVFSKSFSKVAYSTWMNWNINMMHEQAFIK